LNRRDALIGTAMATTTAATTLLTTKFRAEAAMVLHNRRGVDFPRLALNTAGLNMEGTERAFQNVLQVGISHVEFHPGIERNNLMTIELFCPNADDVVCSLPC